MATNPKSVIPAACPYCGQAFPVYEIPINWGEPPDQWSLGCTKCHATTYFDAPASEILQELKTKGVL